MLQTARRLATYGRRSRYRAHHQLVSTVVQAAVFSRLHGESHCALIGRGALAGRIDFGADPTAALRAGTAKQDITPTKPVQLSGYEARKGLSQGVHDPLSVRVVAFQQGEKRLVLVSTDILGFYGGTADSMRKAIMAACHLQPSELFLSAIHTHSGPIVTLGGSVHPNNVEYTKTLETSLVAAVRECWLTLRRCESALARVRRRWA